MRNLSLTLYFVLSLSLASAASVKDVCSIKRNDLKTVVNLDQVEQTVCDLDKSSNDEVIHQTAQDVISVIQYLKATDPTNLMDQQLGESLQKMAEALSLKAMTRKFVASSKDPIGLGLTELFSQYGAEESRWKNPDAYAQKLMSLLSLSKEGKRVVDCFQRQEDKRILGRKITFYPREESSGEKSVKGAEYTVRPVEGKAGYEKVISIDPGASPAATLSFLAHELQHSCNSKEFLELASEQANFQAKYKDFFNSLHPDPSFHTPAQQETYAEYLEQFTKSKKRFDIRAAIDEMRAYNMQPGLFAEYAKYMPEFFCDRYYVSSMFGTQIMGLGEYMSTVEQQFADKNKFVHTLIDGYTRIYDPIKNNGYNPKDFYVFDEAAGFFKTDASGRMILRTEVKQEFKAAGFDLD